MAASFEDFFSNFSEYIEKENTQNKNMFRDMSIWKKDYLKQQGLTNQLIRGMMKENKQFNSKLITEILQNKNVEADKFNKLLNNKKIDVLIEQIKKGRKITEDELEVVEEYMKTFDEGMKKFASNVEMSFGDLLNQYKEFALRSDVSEEDKKKMLSSIQDFLKENVKDSEAMVNYLESMKNEFDGLGGGVDAITKKIDQVPQALKIKRFEADLQKLSNSLGFVGVWVRDISSKVSETFSKWFKKLFEHFKDKTGSFLRGALEWFLYSTPFGGLLNKLGVPGLLVGLGGFLMSTFLPGVFKYAGKFLMWSIKSLSKFLWQGIKWVLPYIGAAFQSAFAWFAATPIATTISSALTGIVGAEIAAGIGGIAAIGVAVASIAVLVGLAWGFFKGFVKTDGDFKDKMLGGIDGMQQTVVDGLNLVWKTITGGDLFGKDFVKFSDILKGLETMQKLYNQLLISISYAVVNNGKAIINSLSKTFDLITQLPINLGIRVGKEIQKFVNSSMVEITQGYYMLIDFISPYLSAIKIGFKQLTKYVSGIVTEVYKLPENIVKFFINNVGKIIKSIIGSFSLNNIIQSIWGSMGGGNQDWGSFNFAKDAIDKVVNPKNANKPESPEKNKDKKFVDYATDFLNWFNKVDQGTGSKVSLGGGGGGGGKPEKVTPTVKKAQAKAKDTQDGVSNLSLVAKNLTQGKSYYKNGCAAYVSDVLKSAGIPYHSLAVNTMYADLTSKKFGGIKIPASQAMAGDIVGWRGSSAFGDEHVGIAVSPTQVSHVMSSKGYRTGLSPISYFMSHQDPFVIRLPGGGNPMIGSFGGLSNILGGMLGSQAQPLLNFASSIGGSIGNTMALMGMGMGGEGGQAVQFNSILTNAIKKSVEADIPKNIIIKQPTTSSPIPKISTKKSGNSVIVNDFSIKDSNLDLITNSLLA